MRGCSQQKYEGHDLVSETIYVWTRWMGMTIYGRVCAEHHALLCLLAVMAVVREEIYPVFLEGIGFIESNRPTFVI